MNERIGLPGISRRGHKRSSCALAVRWTHGAAVELGYASNLSIRGFCLRTRQLHSPGYAQLFTVSFDGGEVAMRARVVWSRELQVESHIMTWHEMGLQFVDKPSAEYFELLKRVENPPVERRRHRRLTHAVSVEIKHRGTTYLARSLDVSPKGLLIVSPFLPKQRDDITVTMKLPGTAAPTILQAQVVRHIEHESVDESSAFAIQFQGLSEEEERMFINYLRIVKELGSFGSVLS